MNEWTHALRTVTSVGELFDGNFDNQPRGIWGKVIPDQELRFAELRLEIWHFTGNYCIQLETELAMIASLCKDVIHSKSRSQF